MLVTISLLKAVRTSKCRGHFAGAPILAPTESRPANPHSHLKNSSATDPATAAAAALAAAAAPSAAAVRPASRLPRLLALAARRASATRQVAASGTAPPAAAFCAAASLHGAAPSSCSGSSGRGSAPPQGTAPWPTLREAATFANSRPGAAARSVGFSSTSMSARA